jgi:circadian clock protein KaiB
MKKSKMDTTTQAYEQALKSNRDKYVLRLYVAGLTPQSSRAIVKVKELCQKHLKGFHKLEVIDIYQQPELARKEQIIAAPTLVKLLPPPLRKFIGDLSNAENLIRGLELQRTK